MWREWHILGYYSLLGSPLAFCISLEMMSIVVLHVQSTHMHKHHWLPAKLSFKAVNHLKQHVEEKVEDSLQVSSSSDPRQHKHMRGCTLGGDSVPMWAHTWRLDVRKGKGDRKSERGEANCSAKRELALHSNAPRQAFQPLHSKEKGENALSDEWSPLPSIFLSALLSYLMLFLSFQCSSRFLSHLFHLS